MSSNVTGCLVIARDNEAISVTLCIDRIAGAIRELALSRTSPLPIIKKEPRFCIWLFDRAFNTTSVPIPDGSPIVIATLID
jgi:hypothetical protein